MLFVREQGTLSSTSWMRVASKPSATEMCDVRGHARQTSNSRGRRKLQVASKPSASEMCDVRGTLSNSPDWQSFQRTCEDVHKNIANHKHLASCHRCDHSHTRTLSAEWRYSNSACPLPRRCSLNNSDERRLCWLCSSTHAVSAAGVRSVFDPLT
jgi:hypothetical protein